MRDQLRDLPGKTDALTQEIEKLRASAPQSGDWTGFVTTTVSRVGIVLLLVFLVGILVNLYRYNTRLAAFYEGRADALWIADMFPEMRLDELVATLAPDGMDYGRMPKSPADQAVALAREIVNAGKQLRS